MSEKILKVQTVRGTEFVGRVETIRDTGLIIGLRVHDACIIQGIKDDKGGLHLTFVKVNHDKSFRSYVDIDHLHIVLTMELDQNGPAYRHYKETISNIIIPKLGMGIGRN